MRVVLASNNDENINVLMKYLEEGGYKVVAKARDGFDTIKLCRQHNPNIILIDIEMPLLDGISAAQVIRDEDIAGSVVFISSNFSKKLIDKMKLVEARGCIFTPIEKHYLTSTIEIASHMGNQIRTIKKEKQELEKKFEDRKAIDKAKGMLMVSENITEEEAYSKIRKLSMSKSVTMREIAEFIIISNKFKI
ncbi:MAG: ANTAR domain-containing response regulator [Peptostreptococcaceae bacterium]